MPAASNGFACGGIHLFYKASSFLICASQGTNGAAHSFYTAFYFSRPEPTCAALPLIKPKLTGVEYEKRMEITLKI